MPVPDPPRRAGSAVSPVAAVHQVETVIEDWLTVRRYTLDLRGSDGTTRRLTRLSVGRGDRVAVVLRDPARGTVILTRQFRLPVLIHSGSNGSSDGSLIEVPGGLTDGSGIQDAVVREAEEETGYRAGNLVELATVYSAPQLSSERVSLFAAEYSADDRVGPGGGVAAEGEDIEVFEIPLAEAIERLLQEPAADAKTLLLLLLAQYRESSDPIGSPRKQTSQNH